MHFVLRGFYRGDDKTTIVALRCTDRMEERRVNFDEKCAFTLNGEPCKVEDLRGGDKLEVDGKPAISVKAIRG